MDRAKDIERLFRQAKEQKKLPLQKLINSLPSEEASPTICKLEKEAVVQLMQQILDGQLQELVEKEGCANWTPQRLVEGFFVLLPGTVPTIALEEGVLAYLSGVPTTIISSNQLKKQTSAVVRELYNILGDELGPVLQVAPYDQRAEFLAQAWPAARIYGTNKTINTLKRSQKFGAQRIQGFGSMTSWAIINSDQRLKAHELKTLLGDIQKDILTWNHEGCFSPRQIYIIGPKKVWQQLRKAFTNMIQSQKPHTQRSIQREATLATATMNGHNVVRGTIDFILNTTLAQASTFPPKVVGLSHIENIKELKITDNPTTFSSIGYYSPTKPPPKVIKLKNICHRWIPIGKMQSPNINRKHDGKKRLQWLSSS